MAHQWDISGPRHMKIEETDDSPNAGINLPFIVDPFEAERIVESLETFEINEVGSSKWLNQHKNIERLNLQSHQSASSNSDEFILESILTFDKIGVLIQDLILIEAWKEFVFPNLIDSLAGKNNMRLYFILYHEATLINLLEVLFYHKHVCESGGEKMIEVVDYLGRKLVKLNSMAEDFREKNLFKEREYDGLSAKEFAAKLESKSPKEELLDHLMEIEFRVCISAVSVARFVCEHADVLSLSTISRITDTHDFLILIIPLIENPPWTRRTQNGKWQKLIEFKWKEVQPIDLLKITKTEGQPWLAIYHLLAKSEFRERYHLNTFRKNQLLRIRKYLNEIMLDQLPFLADIQRYMDELSLTEVPEPNSLASNNHVFLFQQVATIREGFIKNKNWLEIAETQIKCVFTMQDKNDQDIFSMADLYSNEFSENISEV